MQRTFSLLTAIILVLGSAAGTTHITTPKMRGASGAVAMMPELHMAPNVASPVHGIREGAQEELLRLEQLATPKGIGRPTRNTGTFRDLCSTDSGHAQSLRPKSFFRSNTVSALFFYARQNGARERYPIPPPQTAG